MSEPTTFDAQELLDIYDRCADRPAIRAKARAAVAGDAAPPIDVEWLARTLHRLNPGHRWQWWTRDDAGEGVTGGDSRTFAEAIADELDRSAPESTSDARGLTIEPSRVQGERDTTGVPDAATWRLALAHAEHDHGAFARNCGDPGCPLWYSGGSAPERDTTGGTQWR